MSPGTCSHPPLMVLSVGEDQLGRPHTGFLLVSGGATATGRPPGPGPSCPPLSAQRLPAGNLLELSPGARMCGFSVWLGPPHSVAASELREHEAEAARPLGPHGLGIPSATLHSHTGPCAGPTQPPGGSDRESAAVSNPTPSPSLPPAPCLSPPLAAKLTRRTSQEGPVENAPATHCSGNVRFIEDSAVIIRQNRFAQPWPGQLLTEQTGFPHSRGLSGLGERGDLAINIY